MGVPVVDGIADVPGKPGFGVNNLCDCSGEFYALATVSAPNVELTRWTVLVPTEGAAGPPR